LCQEGPFEVAAFYFDAYHGMHEPTCIEILAPFGLKANSYMKGISGIAVHSKVSCAFDWVRW
jgi:hypothetical protein